MDLINETKSRLKSKIDPSEVIHLYIEERKNISEISKLLGVNFGTIKLRLMRSGISLRSHSEEKLVTMNRPDVKKRVSEASKKSYLKRKETNIKKYGHEVPADGINWQDKYEKENHVRHPSQLDKNIQRMKLQNPMDNQNSKDKVKFNRWTNKSEEELVKIRNKSKLTCLKNFNYDNPLKSKLIIDKIKETNIKRRNVDWITKDPYIKQKVQYTRLTNFIPEINHRLNILNLELTNDFSDVTSIVTLKCKNVIQYLNQY